MVTDRAGLRNLEGRLHNWLKKADIADGDRPGLTDDERKELREANKQIRVPCQGVGRISSV